MDFNQDYQYTSQNNGYSQKPEPIDKLAVASMVLGICSIMMCCTGVLSVPLGALGILFAVLTRRLGKGMPHYSVIGVVLSCIGIALGLTMLIYSIYLILTDPTYRALYNQYYEQFSQMQNYTL